MIALSLSIYTYVYIYICTYIYIYRYTYEHFFVVGVVLISRLTTRDSAGSMTYMGRGLRGCIVEKNLAYVASALCQLQTLNSRRKQIEAQSPKPYMVVVCLHDQLSQRGRPAQPQSHPLLYSIKCAEGEEERTPQHPQGLISEPQKRKRRQNSLWERHNLA